ncbi:MAG TPA: tail fiber domain-containing protein [Casimicrobiaceae bacterium]|nr:tail fiber domain-containing protein [Casimicrobiaceae bacterium]
MIGSATTCIIGNGAGPTSCTASDQRLKDNVTGLDAPSSLSAVRQLNPVSFVWNSFMTGNGAPTSTQFGFIAQDVAKVFPNLVAQDAHTG